VYEDYCVARKVTFSCRKYETISQN